MGQKKNSGLYPSLKLNWRERTEPQLELIVTPELLETIAKLAAVSDIELLKAAVLKALDAYADAAFDRLNQRSESQANEALARVSDASKELYDALLFLMEYPGLEPRVERVVKSHTGLYDIKGKYNLADMIGGNCNTFQDYREVLVDLQVCVEDVINRKPKPLFVDDGVGGKYQLIFEAEENIAAGMQQWRKRSKERNFPKDHALQAFLLSFRDYWTVDTPHPFTEGMYHPDQGQTVANFVDVVEAVLPRLDGDVTRQKIVNAIRKIRKMRTKTVSS